MKSKPLFIILFLAYTLSAFSQSDAVNLTVYVKESQNDTIMLTSGFSVRRVNKVAEGHYSARIPVGTGFFQLFMGTQRMRIYLEPGQSTTITFNREDMVGTATFSGFGAAENQWIRKQERYDDAIELQLDQCQDEIQCLRDLIYKRNSKLEGKLKDNKLDADFRNIMLGDIRSSGEEMKTKLKALTYAEALKGKAMPKLTLYNAAGKKVGTELFKNKYVYIDVWATWCGPCLKEEPYFAALTEKFKDKNIAFVKVSIDDERTLANWEKHIEGDPNDIINFVTKKGWESDIITKFSGEGRGIPLYILVAPDGTIINANAPRPSDVRTAQLLQSL